MKTYVMMGLMVSALLAAGCVSKDKYVAATTEVDSVKADL
jgi:outer membrane murein-binding lipoprotein Lpp